MDCVNRSYNRYYLYSGGEVKMSKIYDDFGWLNWDWLLEQTASIIPVVGSRGVGKTYGGFKKLIKEHKPFIYLRRLKSQLELCATKEGNPFKKINKYNQE